MVSAFYRPWYSDMRLTSLAEYSVEVAFLATATVGHWLKSVRDGISADSASDRLS